MNAHFRRIGLAIFWGAAILLALTVVPVMRNPSAIPMMVFSIIVLVTASALWGTGIIGKEAAVTVATIVLVLSVLSLFLPRTARRVPAMVNALDASLASIGTSTPETDDVPTANPTSSSSSSPASAPLPCSGPREFQPTKKIPPAGLLVNLCQGWKSFPKGGCIIITTPSGRELRDCPGESNNWGYQPDGTYSVRSDPPGSNHAVQFYNRRW